MKKFPSSTERLTFVIALTSLLIGLAGMVFSSYKTHAATLNAGALQIEYDGSGALFNELNIAPGFTTTKTIKVTNTGTVPHSFSIAINKTLGPLSNVLHIKTSYDGSDVWDKTISDIAKYDKSEPIIGSISPGVSKNVLLTAYLPSEVGNEYMGTSTFAFDFVVGNESTDQNEPGSFTSPSTGGSLGQRISRAITYNPPAGTAEPTPPTDQKTEGDKVAGAESAKGETTVAKSLCFWWLVIIIIFIISLVLYHRFIKEEKPMFWWFWPIIIAAVLYFVQAYFDKTYQPTIFCHWFWALELVVLAVYFAIDFRNENRG